MMKTLKSASPVRQLAMLTFAIASTAAAAFDPTQEKARIAAILERTYPHLESLYKDIHTHPELGFHETRTAAILAKQIRALGFEVTEGFGGSTGIVAVYRNGPGPTIMIRTELDALPMEDKTGLPYASHVQVPASWSADNDSNAPGTIFVTHSCGHDIHMAWWLGTAQTLVALKNEWQGTLVFVGEPAEEIGGGATGMLEAGLLSKFPKPDYGFAAHVSPDLAGTITMKDGAFSGNSDTFQVVFRGRGGHGANPERTIDPIVIAAHFVTDVQTIVSREKSPALAGVISVGSFHAGSAGNIIPDHADLKLTMRSTAPQVRTMLLEGMKRTANAVAEMANAPAPEFRRIGGGATSGVNDSALVARTRPVVDAAFGNRVNFVSADVPGHTGVETYAEFINAGVPSIFYYIGGTDPKLIAAGKASGAPVPGNHSPDFAPVPETSIRTGVELLTLSVLNVAKTDGQP